MHHRASSIIDLYILLFYVYSNLIYVNYILYTLNL